MSIYNSYYGYGKKSEKKPFPKTFVRLMLINESSQAPEVSSPKQAPTSTEVEYYANLHRMLTRQFFKNYELAMEHAKKHPEDVVTTRASF